MNINDLREHVRSIISERIYSNGGLTPDYEAIYNDFMQSVEKQGGIKSDNGNPLTELEGTAFVFGENYEFEFDYEVYNRQFVKARHGDNYNEPEYEELGGDFDFAITNAKVMDKEGDFVCDFDEIAERFDGGYDTVKEWFVFNESDMIEPYNYDKNEEDDYIYEARHTPIGLKLLEAFNLGKIQKHGQDGFVVISANRSNVTSSNPSNDLTKPYLNWCKKKQLKPTEKSEAEFLKTRNAKADDTLLKDIRSKGYTYSMTYGGYHGSDEIADSYEPSFVVYNHKKSGEVSDWNELFAFAISACKKFHQDSVYVQAPNEAPNYYDANGRVVNTKSSKNFKLNRGNEEFYTTTKREKSNPQRFTADIVFEGKYYKPALKHEYVDRMRRTQYGEIFLG